SHPGPALCRRRLPGPASAGLARAGGTDRPRGRPMTSPVTSVTRPARADDDNAASTVGEIPLITPRVRAASPRPWWLSLTIRVSVPAAIVAVWWIGSATGLIQPEVLAGPPAVWIAGVELTQSGELAA